MKKFMCFIASLLCLLCVPLCGCTKADDDPYKDVKTNESSYLVCYFSVTNNTAEMAHFIAGELDADIVRIVPTTAYPTKYSELSVIAQEERSTDARPSIKSSVGSTEGYEYVFIGFPVWFDDIPNIIRTFAQNNTFADKIIIPFCTHGSSGGTNSFATLKTLYPDNEFRTGLAVVDDEVKTENAKTQIRQWLDSMF